MIAKASALQAEVRGVGAASATTAAQNAALTESLTAAAGGGKAMTSSMAAIIEAANGATASERNLSRSLLQQAAGMYEATGATDAQIAALKAFVASSEAYVNGIRLSTGATALMTATVDFLNAELERLIALQKAASTPNFSEILAGYEARSALIAKQNLGLETQIALQEQISRELRKQMIEQGALGTEAGLSNAGMAGSMMTALNANIAGLKSKLKELTPATEELTAAQLRQLAVGSGLNYHVANMISLAKQFLPLILAIAAGMTLWHVTSAAVSNAADFEKLHQRMGIATEDLSVISYAAKQVGVDMNDVAISMRMLDRHVDAAVHGNKATLQNFKEIGMSLADLKTLDPVSIFQKFATGVTAIVDPTTRSAKATELMGRASERLLPLLNLLAGSGYGKLTEEATKLGVIVSGEAAQSALEFERNWAKVKLVMAGVGNSIMSAVIPALLALMKTTSDVGDNSQAEYIKLISPWERLTIYLKAVEELLYSVWQVMTAIMGISLVKAIAGLVKDDVVKGIDKKSLEDAWATLREPFTNIEKAHAVLSTTYNATNPNARSVTDRSADDSDAARKAAERLEIARDQLEVAKAQLAVTGASNALEALDLNHRVKIAEIVRATAQAEKHAGTDHALWLTEWAVGATKITTENAKYAQERQDLITKGSEELRILRAQVEVQNLQVQGAGRIGDLAKIELEGRIKLLDIKDREAAAVNALQNATGGKRDIEAEQKIAAQHALAAAEITAQTIRQARAVEDVKMSREASVRVMNLEADAAKRNLTIAENSAESEVLRSHEVQTRADIERVATLARSSAELEYQTKRLAAENEADTKIKMLRQDLNAYLRLYMAGDNASLADAQATRRQIESEESKRATNALIGEKEQQAKITGIDLEEERRRVDAIRYFQGNSRLEELTGAASAAREIAATRKTIEAQAAADAAALQLHVFQLEVQRWQDLGHTLGDALVQGMDDIFSGAKFGTVIGNFAKAMQRVLGASLKDMVSKWATDLGTVASGGVVLGKDGKPTSVFGGGSKDQAQTTLTAIQSASAAVSLWQQAQAGASKSQNTMSGAAAGASIGMAAGPWGAVAGAVIGAAYGYVFAAIASGSKARFQVSVGADGKITATGFGNASQSDVDNAVRGLNETLKNGTDAIRAILNAFPTAIGAMLGTMDPTILKTGLVGDPVEKVRTFAISIFKKSFAGGFTADQLKHFNDVELPKLIFDAYAPILTIGLTQLGVAEAKLKELFDTTGAGFDPKQGLQDILDYVTVLTNFVKASQRVVSVGASLTDLSNAHLDPNGNQKLPGESDFMNSVRLTAESIFARLATDGVDSLAAWKDIGASVEGVTKSLTDFTNHLADVQRALDEAFSSSVFEHNLIKAQQPKDYLGNPITPTSEGNDAFARAVKIIADLDSLGSTHGDTDFVANLKLGTESIFQQAQAMVRLTGPERAAAFKQLGLSVEQVTKSLSDYIAHIADVLKSLQSSFQQAAYQHALAAAGEVKDYNGNIIHKDDPNARARIMEAEYGRLLSEINNASSLGLTADQVAQDTTAAMGILEQLFALDPTKAAEEWYQRQMRTLEADSTASIKALGAAARTAVDKLLAELKPFTDYVKGIPVDLKAAMDLLTGPGGAFPGFAAALKGLTSVVTGGNRFNRGELLGSGTQDVLMTEYNKTLDQIKNAGSLGLSADQVQSLTGRAMQLANQIYAANPTAAMDKWWGDQMTLLSRISKDAITAIGVDARDAVTKLLTEMKPFTDYFKGLPVDLKAATDLLSGPGGVFANFGAALTDLTTRVNNAVTTPQPPPGGGNDDGDGKVRGNSIINITVPVTVSGDVIGIDDFDDHVISLVTHAIKNNSTLIESKWR